MPTVGNAAASTALPQPPNTSQNVPISSANALLPKGMMTSLSHRPACYGLLLFRHEKLGENIRSATAVSTDDDSKIPILNCCSKPPLNLLRLPLRFRARSANLLGKTAWFDNYGEMFWRPWASINFCGRHLRPAKQFAYVFECAALTAEVVNFGGCHDLIGNSHRSSSYRHRSERDAHATLIRGPDTHLNPVIALALDAPTFVTFGGLKFHLDAPAALRNALT